MWTLDLLGWNLLEYCIIMNSDSTLCSCCFQTVAQLFVAYSIFWFMCGNVATLDLMLREGHGTGVVIRYSALSTDLQPVGDFNSENDVSTEFCRSSSGIFTRTLDLHFNFLNTVILFLVFS